MRHHISGSGRAVVSAVALAVVLTACSGSDGGADSSDKSGKDSKAATDTSSSPTGVISLKAAQDTLLNYSKINNEANAARDPKKIAEVEDGALRQQSLATFTQFKT
ncbi:hypothetical protein AB4Z54_13005, partial [Streptomyces sp. MCAF7]